MNILITGARSGMGLEAAARERGVVLKILGR